MSEDQDRAHMTMWCMLSSPLIAGNDLRSMSAATRAILTNVHAIRVNQDDLGLQATLVNGSAHPTRAVDPRATVEQTMARAVETPPHQVWAKQLASPAGAWALALLNRDAEASATISASFAEAVGAAAGAKFDVLDLWADAHSIGVHTDSLSATLAPSSAAMYKLVPATIA